MASNARKAFDENAEDIERLLELHEEKGGVLRGRRVGLEVLNKSAIVLITSFWEAYCEDIAAEGLEHLIVHVNDPKKLPTSLMQQVAKELRGEKNELAIWSLAAEGWKRVLTDRLERLREQRNRQLNTPKAEKIDELFFASLGVKRISDSWFWLSKMKPDRARAKLDRFVTLRGAIAHRGAAASSVTKSQVEDYFEFVKKLVSKTGGHVNAYVKKVSGSSLW